MRRMSAVSLRRGLKPIALLATMYLMLCGGPFGNEQAVPTAGPGLTILVTVVMALIWAVPYALLVAEMVSALPLEGGLYQWFRAGLGPFWSFQFSFLDWITWVMDAALYPPLVAAYLLTFLPGHQSRLAHWSICMVVIWGCTWLHVRGIKAVGRLSVLMTLAQLAPVAVLVVLGWSSIGMSHLHPYWPPGQPFGTALNYALVWALWNYSGYGALASAGEETVDPQRNYPKVLALFVPLSVAVYVLPLLVALGVTPDWRHWGAGHLNQVAYVLGGTGLLIGMAVAAQIANLGLLNGELLVISRTPYAMARDGLLPRALAVLHPRHGTPARILILQAVLFSILTYFFNFIELLVVSTWLALPSYLLTFATPLVLRWKRPDLRGPFRIPGGWPVLIVTALVPTLIALYVLCTIQMVHLLIGLGFALIGPLLYWTMRARAR
jgi:amino acid transporter